MRSSRPDWRDADAYAALLGADRSLIAWEWLRRDIAYVRAWEAAGSAGSDAGAAPFGLVAFEAPERSVPGARPLWRAEDHPSVLAVDPVAGPARECLRLDAFRDLATLVRTKDADHLLLSDGWRAIRLDGPSGTFECEEVCLQYRLQGLGGAEAPLLTLRRFLNLCRTGRFGRQLHPQERRARRWILLLRTLDGLLDDATQRDIAEELLDRSAGASRWRDRMPSLRLRAQRLVRCARQFAKGRYREFLLRG